MYPYSNPCLAFEALQQGSKFAAQQLQQLLSQESDGPNSRTVALLCPSSVDFLFTWLGLMYAGYSVLLIAYVLLLSQIGRGVDANSQVAGLNVNHLLSLIYVKAVMSQPCSSTRHMNL